MYVQIQIQIISLSIYMEIVPNTKFLINNIFSVILWTSNTNEKKWNSHKSTHIYT